MKCKQCEFRDESDQKIMQHKGNDTMFCLCVNPVLNDKDSGFLRISRGGKLYVHAGFGCNFGERRREVKK